MQEISGRLNIGLILLSSDFGIVGMNPYAQNMLGPTISEWGQTVFACHKQPVHPKNPFVAQTVQFQRLLPAGGDDKYFSVSNHYQYLGVKAPMSGQLVWA